MLTNPPSHILEFLPIDITKQKIETMQLRGRETQGWGRWPLHFAKVMNGPLVLHRWDFVFLKQLSDILTVGKPPSDWFNIPGDYSDRCLNSGYDGQPPEEKKTKKEAFEFMR